jgi:hypothetical protein
MLARSESSSQYLDRHQQPYREASAGRAVVASRSKPARKLSFSSDLRYSALKHSNSAAQGKAVMKKALMVLGLSATLALIAGPAQARRWHHAYCDGITYTDYNQSNNLSPGTYIYPAANWGPFFHCVRHFGPVIYMPHVP